MPRRKDKERSLLKIMFSRIFAFIRERKLEKKNHRSRDLEKQHKHVDPSRP